MDNYNAPKYEVVKNYLKHLMKENELLFGEKLPSEHELMEKFKISRHTVRQALGDLSAEGLIYKMQGRGTFSNFKNGNKNKQMVAVLTTYMSAYVFPGILSGIESVLSEEGYIMLLSSTNNSKKREAELLTTILKHDVVGLIIEPTRSAFENDNIALLEEVRKRGIKTVFINACYDNFDSSYVIMDDVKGGYLLTEYLIQLGHRRIAGIFKTDDKQGVKRKEGYLAALKKYGIEADLALIGEYSTSTLIDYPYMFTQSIIKGDSAPTAIVSYNDQCAMLIVQAINDKGLTVPQDISVVGYDDSIQFMQADVQLTTIRHPKKEMGIQAAKFLTNMLDGIVEEPQMIYRPELIVRNSCKNI